MKLDIKKLKRSPGQNLPVEWSEESEPVDHRGGTLTLTKPIRAHGKALFQSGVLHTHLTVETEAETECSRCLKAIRVPVKLEEFLEFIEEPPEGLKTALMEEFSFEHGASELELMPYIAKLISSSLDLKPLCKADCQGLCPTCGKDQNQGKCKCSVTTKRGDPRLEKLKEMLSTRE